MRGPDGVTGFSSEVSNPSRVPVHLAMIHVDCGKTFSNGAEKAPDNSGCNMVCNGNSTEYCGGPGALNVYSYGGQLLPTRYVTRCNLPKCQNARNGVAKLMTDS